MGGAAEVAGGVPVRRRIAAADVPPGRAAAQVDPPRTDPKALQAAVAARWGGLDGIKVTALVHHVCS
ncbi:MAG: hypothetical protein ACRDQ4_16275 [Pseudonocardiaceae bacterium]